MNFEKISTDEPYYEQALELRYQLFFEEFGLPKGSEKDELEARSIHLGITDENFLIAYGRLTDLGSGIFKISQVVVLPKLQGQGYGKALLQQIIKLARGAGASSIELNSQVSAISLYESLGFAESGVHYPSRTTGIPHVKMVLGAAT